jgi:hypothetical protein
VKQGSGGTALAASLFACSVAAAAAVAAACDSPNTRTSDNCVPDTPAVQGQQCFSPGSRCPMETQPGTVCFDSGISPGTCTCADASWACDEDAALTCSQPACSFGAPCHGSQQCVSPSRGTTLVCDPTGHLVECMPGMTMTMGCDQCTCEAGAWTCSTDACTD